MISELDRSIELERSNLAELSGKWRKGDITDEEPDLPNPNEYQGHFEDDFGGGFGEYFGRFHDEGDNISSSDSPNSDSYSSISHTSQRRRIRSTSPLPTPTRRNYNLRVQERVNYNVGSSSRRRRRTDPVSTIHILVFFLEILET